MIRSSRCRFIEGKSCLTNLSPFYDGTTGCTDKGRAVDVVYLTSARFLILSPMLSSYHDGQCAEHESAMRLCGQEGHWYLGCIRVLY